MRISGVLLAAGKSERMGKNKLLLRFGNHTVIEESLLQLAESGLDEVIVVTGFQMERLKSLIENKSWSNVRIVSNENYNKGRAESIKCALGNIDKRSEAVLFMVADKPSVKSSLIRKALSEFKSEAPLILYVQTPAGRGHPVIFSKALFGDLMGLGGEPTGNAIFEKYRDDTVVIEDENPQFDIDTLEDYDNILKETAK
ncbi:MAG: nucleotidyltransferase family protein [Candidatus Zixiibacteriota bacterium]|nr:MAG: nucleotidyltransferase family protein [candidate division Zixibacteria bacterium]